MNPWDVKERNLWSAFVEKLQPNFERLQWAIDAPSMNTNKDARGNQVFSEFSEKPESFSRLGFEAFGKLLAYPHLQIRHVINHILRENLMPLDNDLTATIVKQAMYQVGEMSRKQELFWKLDWNSGDAKDCMNKELLSLANHLRSTPRRYKDLKLLGDLAGFLAQYGKQYSEPSFRFSEVAEGWANDLRTELNQNSMGNSNEKNIQLKAKECLMVGYAIICCSHVHSLNEKAVGSCPLVTEAMIRQEQAIRCQLKNAHMSDAINFVIPAYNIPERAVWTSSKSNCCFDSKVGGHLFSINVITGRVLVDGLPPGRLPPSILNHALYKKHFAARDFQIQPVGPSFVTVDPFNGCFYQFTLDDSNLVIVERNLSEGSTLELLDISAIEWWAELPVRLLEMHSHWFCPDRRALCMRPIDVAEKAISFVGFWKNPCASWKIPRELTTSRKENNGFFAVAIHDSHLTFETLLTRTQTMDQFIHLEGEEICKAVSRLEDPAFVHTLLSPKSEVVISLPRFGLSFTQSGTNFQWMSQQHKGFRLRSNQRLDDAALPYFKQYLILEHPQLKKTQVLLPTGRIAKTNDGFTEVVLSTASHVALKAASFDLHPITKLLRCSSISNQLLLGAISSTA
ncbi:hypothetical protein HDU81_009558 [Chytriomyces hyalinus]|nr:hypothetical protein HDU81_009558 [Chytriomyces hyalinus]